MNITAEKQNILQRIQAIDDEKTIEKTLIFKKKNQVSNFETELIQKGLIDVKLGNVNSNTQVKKRFEEKFNKKCKPQPAQPPKTQIS